MIEKRKTERKKSCLFAAPVGLTVGASSSLFSVIAAQRAGIHTAKLVCARVRACGRSGVGVRRQRVEELNEQER